MNYKELMELKTKLYTSSAKNIVAIYANEKNKQEILDIFLGYMEVHKGCKIKEIKVAHYNALMIERQIRKE